MREKSWRSSNALYSARHACRSQMRKIQIGVHKLNGMYTRSVDAYASTVSGARAGSSEQDGLLGVVAAVCIRVAICTIWACLCTKSF